MPVEDQGPPLLNARLPRAHHVVHAVVGNGNGTGAGVRGELFGIQFPAVHLQAPLLHGVKEQLLGAALLCAQ